MNPIYSRRPVRALPLPNSEGTKKTRLHLFPYAGKPGEDRYAVAAKKINSKNPSLGWLDRKYYLLYQGKDGWYKINKSSLQKRLGITSNQLKAVKNSTDLENLITKEMAWRTRNCTRTPTVFSTLCMQKLSSSPVDPANYEKVLFVQASNEKPLFEKDGLAKGITFDELKKLPPKSFLIVVEGDNDERDIFEKESKEIQELNQSKQPFNIVFIPTPSKGPLPQSIVEQIEYPCVSAGRAIYNLLMEPKPTLKDDRLKVSIWIFKGNLVQKYKIDAIPTDKQDIEETIERAENLIDAKLLRNKQRATEVNYACIMTGDHGYEFRALSVNGKKVFSVEEMNQCFAEQKLPVIVTTEDFPPPPRSISPYHGIFADIFSILEMGLPGTVFWIFKGDLFRKFTLDEEDYKTSNRGKISEKLEKANSSMERELRKRGQSKAVLRWGMISRMKAHKLFYVACISQTRKTLALPDLDSKRTNKFFVENQLPPVVQSDDFDFSPLITWETRNCTKTATNFSTICMSKLSSSPVDPDKYEKVLFVQAGNEKPLFEKDGLAKGITLDELKKLPPKSFLIVVEGDEKDIFEKDSKEIRELNQSKQLFNIVFIPPLPNGPLPQSIVEQIECL